MARDGSISPEGWITCYVKLLFEKSLRWLRWLRMDEIVEMAVFTCVRFWCNKHQISKVKLYYISYIAIVWL